jgi:hypothetical protein
MLSMTAFKIRHPMVFLILVISDNFASHNSSPSFTVITAPSPPALPE